MIGLGYVKAKSYLPSASTDESMIVSGRCALLSVVTHAKAVTNDFQVVPLIFKNGASGDVLYKVQPSARDSTLGVLFTTYYHIIGGAGILFENGIYLDTYASTGTGASAYDVGVDQMVLFYT